MRGIQLSVRMNRVLAFLLCVSVLYMMHLLFSETRSAVYPDVTQLPPLLFHDSENPTPGDAPRDVEVERFFVKRGANRRPMSPVTCTKLLEGDLEAQAVAKEYMKNHPRKVIPDSTYIRLTKNCTEFKLRRGYFSEPLSEEESSFPIAYSILMYKHVEQVEQLLRAVYQPQNVYCIHVDKRSSDIIHMSVRALTRCFHNVFIASKLERVVYAGYSRLQADVNCMADVLRYGKPWRYYINLASQAFPIKTNLEMVKILKIYNGSNDIEGMWKRVIKGRFKKRFEEKILPSGKTRVVKFMNVTNPEPPCNISIVRGSAYGIFSNGFVDFIVNDDRAKALLEWSRFTYSPDEFYWSTLNHIAYNMHLKTPGGYAGDADTKPWLATYASWGRRDVDPCYSGRTARGVCIFGLADLPQLLARKEFIANKFFPDYEYLAMDCLDEWLYNKSMNPQPFDTYYYRKLPFINGPILVPPTKPPRKKEEKKPTNNKKDKKDGNKNTKTEAKAKVVDKKVVDNKPKVNEASAKADSPKLDDKNKLGNNNNIDNKKVIGDNNSKENAETKDKNEQTEHNSNEVVGGDHLDDKSKQLSAKDIKKVEAHPPKQPRPDFMYYYAN